MLALFLGIVGSLYVAGRHLAYGPVMKAFVEMDAAGKRLPFWAGFWSSPIYFIYYFACTQLCLIYPFLAVSEEPSVAHFWDNIRNVRGNRFQVWIVSGFFHLCFYTLFSLLIYGITRWTFAQGYHGSIPHLSRGLAHWVAQTLCITSEAVFYAIIFDDFGVREKNRSKT